MVRAIGRWVLPCLALFILGPIMGRLVGTLHAGDGGHDITLLVGAAPAMGLVFGLGSVIVALAYGALAGKMLGERTGTLSGGLLLAWIAWNTGDLGMILRFDGSAATLIKIAVEAALVGGVVLAGTALIARWSEDTQPKATGVRDELKALTSPASLAGLAAGAAAALAVAWLVAFDGIRGQALMAAVFGAIAAGAVSRLVAMSLADGHPARLMPYASVLLAAIVGPLIGFAVPGAANLSSAVIDGTIAGPLLVEPLDWAAAMLLGVPIGIGWTAAITHAAGESKPARAH
jgi:predicted permease